MDLTDLQFPEIATIQYVQGTFTIQLSLGGLLVPRNLFDMRKREGYITIVDELENVQHFPVRIHPSSTQQQSVFTTSVDSKSFAVGKIRVIATAYGPFREPIFIRELYEILGE